MWISLERAKAFLRIDHDDDDILVGMLINAAQSHIEAITGLRFEASTETVTLDGWQARFAIGPVQSVASVAYTDATGTPQTLGTSAYRLVAQGLSAALRGPVGAIWPTTAYPIAVTATVGYPDGELPAAVRAAALLLLGDLYTFREDTIAERSVTPVSLPNGVDALLTNFRVY